LAECLSELTFLAILSWKLALTLTLTFGIVLGIVLTLRSVDKSGGCISESFRL
jgi:hypothetical protein